MLKIKMLLLVFALILTVSAIAAPSTIKFHEGWITASELEPGLYRIEENKGCSYLLIGQEAAVLVDTAYGAVNLKEVCQQLTSLPITVILTHGHVDHIGSAHYFDNVYIHANDAREVQKGINGGARRWSVQQILANPMAPVDFDPKTWTIPAVKDVKILKGGETLTFGDIQLEVMETPGHTPGSICLLERKRKLLFSGDTLVPGQMWIHLPESNIDHWLASAEKLSKLGTEVEWVLPGHGSPFSGSILDRLRTIVSDIQSGKAKPVFVGGSNRYVFPEFSILY